MQTAAKLNRSEVSDTWNPKYNKIKKKKTVSATADRGSYMNMNGKCGVFAAVPDLKVGFLISNGQPGPFGEPFVFSSRKYLLQIIISFFFFFNYCH